MRALRPDITLVHGLAADRSGNVIMSYPLSVDAFGAWAAKEGVIVSVEHIVPADYIRQHSHLVRVPSYLVKAVCEVPFGAHPGGLPNCGLPQWEAYFDDYDFAIMLREASMDENRFMNFIQEWILNCYDQRIYLDKLGKDRQRYLKDKAKPHHWVVESMASLSEAHLNDESNQLERMVIGGARYIAELCQKKAYRTLLCGVGLSNLAAWLAAYRLKELKYDIELVAEIGMYGYLPRPSDPTVFSMHNLPSSKMLTNIETALGVLTGGSANQCLGVLGAAQVDKHGNANSTKIPSVFYIVGSGGANDVASAARETVVFAQSGRERLVEKVPYITFPGERVKTLITDVGVFEKLDGRNTFTLTGYIPYATALREEEVIKGVKTVVGWELDVAPQLKKVDLPSHDEKLTVRLFDPRGYFTRP
jgi:acyl CoA:acetate/3-ketoacid CoA transferase beta subunit